MWSFAKDARFKPQKKPWEALYYNLPTTLANRTTTMGFGQKYDMYKNTFKNRTHNIYDIPREFDLRRHNSPQITFGYGREVCKRPELEVKTPVPGVGTYNMRTVPGKDALKFSLFGRTWNYKKDLNVRTPHPCPGTYEDTLATNASGRYVTSLFGNTRNVLFKGPERFKVRKNEVPPPGAYEYLTMFNKTGFHYASRFDSKIAKSFGDRPAEFYQKNKISTTPGPGSYNIFSEFNGYASEKKRCRCGRELGHPPVNSNTNSCNQSMYSKRTGRSDDKYKTFPNLKKGRKNKDESKKGDELDTLSANNTATATNYRTIDNNTLG